MKRNYRIMLIFAIIAILSFTALHFVEESNKKHIKEQGLAPEDNKSIYIQQDTDLQYSLGIKAIEKTILSEEYITLKNWKLLIIAEANNEEGIKKLTQMSNELDFSKTKEGFNTEIKTIGWRLEYNHTNQTINILEKYFFSTNRQFGATPNDKVYTIKIEDDPFFKYMVDITNHYLEQEYKRMTQNQK